ncbi:MAG: hypothetical protein C4520_05525 [Candidatus Abyssobacteria bacterium SURF_5]|uniref:Cytochrome c domain-containing protein n=1 Tax=Abyssobacteria bacterium (strain SURF_5) TaxID=2093360 RepID=A0A3A4NY64_ABYX5|nr:MAG: hypothetical protein C4520_05525 [Candidatus Abyssubacteria bacterium SURF_5]
MADSLNGNSGQNHRPEVFSGLTVPTFDPVTPAGRRARWALLITSGVVLLCLLAAIITEHYLKPWLKHQRNFKSVLAAVAVAEGKSPPPFPQEIKQITSAAYGVSDRCTTCHAGFDNPNLADQKQPYGAHPQWVFDIHPPEQFGCTLCHGGQGLATTTEDAHGTVPHWEDPLIPAGYFQAGCGSCHTHVKVPPQELADRGKRLFEQYDCLACHKVDARGRGTGPDLSTVGIRGFLADWHQNHLELQQQSIEPAWLESYGPIDPEEVTAINAFLNTLMQAPAFVDAKALVYRKGCLGCHRINGTGGDEGPDLSATGKKNPNRLDFSYVEGEHNLANWHKAHLLDPALIVAGSLMPHAELRPEELEAVTLYMLSLRGADVPMNRWPAGRFESERLGKREFSADGKSLYSAFCNSCHGVSGQGAGFGIFTQKFPAVTSQEFLAVASDRFIRENLVNGRPGRKMPPWGTKEGGLRAAEIQSLVEYLRSQQPAAPSWQDVSSAQHELELGKAIYRESCAVCHDSNTAIGPDLSNEVFLQTADTKFLYHMLTQGREDTAMGSRPELNAQELASLIDYIESLRSGKKAKLPVLPPADSIMDGQAVFAESCAPCHAERGEGKYAVNIVNPSLLEAASDDYLGAAVRLGRCIQPKDAPGQLSAPEVTDQQLSNAITYIRRRLAKLPAQAPGRLVQGDAQNGQTLFNQNCTGCHGQGGINGWAPELANSAFLAAATDGYLQASIIRGRPMFGMPAFATDNLNYPRLTAEDVNDTVAFVRALQSKQ